MAQAVSVPLQQGQAAVLVRPSPERDGPTQDAAMVLDLGSRGVVLAVADGVGGLPRGADAAALALQHLERAVRDRVAAGRGGLREGIMDGFDAAHRAVADLAAGAGTTLAAVAVEDGVARPFHVGDSAILVVGQRGKVKHMSVMHSPVGYALEAGVLDEEEAMRHDERHVLFHAIGLADMKIEVGPRLPLAARDTVLLASDGLWDNLGAEEVADVVRAGALASSSQTLLERCQGRMADEARGKHDDLSFVLYRR